MCGVPKWIQFSIIHGKTEVDMLIAVTGVSGFLGSNVVEFFSKNHDVIRISNSIPAEYSASVYNFSDLQDISPMPEVIIHCHAAVSSGTNEVDYQTLFDGNVTATHKIVNQFPLAKHIYISTCSIYDPASSIKIETSNILPATEYAISKLWAENIVLQSNNSIIIRLSSLYGIGMKENTILPNYINQALENNKIKVWGKGTRKQNYIHVTDVVHLIDKIIQKNIWDKKIYLGVGNKEYSNIELAKMISDITNAEIVFVNDDKSSSNQFDNSHTRNELNWMPLADISSEIKKIIEWKQKQS